MARKTFPALFRIWQRGFFPEGGLIVGYARSVLTTEQFGKHVTEHIKCSPEEREAFLKICTYVSGPYSPLDSLRAWFGDRRGVRIYYLALPPSVFPQTLEAIHRDIPLRSGITNRVVIEKPFGRDSTSSAELQSQVARLFTEDEVYRIDHYLGKEMVQNMMVFRFANSIWEPLWNRNFIDCVVISFKEDFGTEGRAGYFDSFGIIRDVMQNHLLQILSIIAMEHPVTLSAEDIRNEKVKVLRAIPPLSVADTVLGQYGPSPDGSEPSYLDEEGVPAGSITPTFAACCFRIHNPRWEGVPFILKCGKSLNERKAEVRIQFKSPPGNLFGNLSRNVLVKRIQPNEAVYLTVATKKPGLTGEIQPTTLDLTYSSRPELSGPLPDAYERLILDVMKGDHSLFVRNDELEVAWGIFTPLLHYLEEHRVSPILYPRGSRGPEEADEFVRHKGYCRFLRSSL
jgi:glucose-6-phosphate 1-dehydrogenase